MLFNITLLILTLILVNAFVFLVPRFIPKTKKTTENQSTKTELPIKLNQEVEIETVSQDLAPTGS